MIKVHTHFIGPDKAIVDRKELGELVEAARQIEEVQLIESGEDLPPAALMRLVEEGGSFQFLEDPREDVYTTDDLRVRYR